MTDRRSPLARARDDFMQSDAGVKCCDPTTLKAHRDQRQYLENRIVRAFMAGAAAGEKLAKPFRRALSFVDPKRGRAKSPTL